MQNLILAFAAGLLSATGFAPLELWPLTLLGFAALFHLLGSASTLRRALALGWWFGVGQFVLGLNWIATAFTFQAAMPAWLGWIAVVLLSLYLAIYPGMAAGLAWRWSGHGRRRVSLVLLLAAAWIVTEWLRGTLFTGFAWNPVGVTLVEVSAGQSAALIGTYGVSGLVILLAGLLLHLLTLRGWRRAWAVPLLLLVAVDLRLPSPPSSGQRITVVQPNIGQEQKYRAGYEEENAERLVRNSKLRTSEPRLLLWPEAAIPYYLEEQPEARTAIAGLLRERDVLLTGGTRIEYDAAGRAVGARNSLFAMNAEGKLLARYDKAHLVPYGEYLPMRPLLSAIGLSRLVPGDLDFWPGPGPGTLVLPGFGTVGIQICYEIVFSGHVVDRAARPGFLFNPSNDAWFGRFGPPQHLAQARLRAIEEGLPIVRATPTGISAVIDANGRLLHSIGWRQEGAIQARLPAARAPTPFALLGNLLPFLMAGLLVLAAVAQARFRR